MIAPWFDTLLLLTAANGAPVVAHRFLGTRGAWPIDGGRLFVDHRPLFGPAKTWRGVLAAVLACCALAVSLGISWIMGGSFALLAVLGDLCSSFVKRRLGLASSSPSFGLDQIPEALLPVAVLATPLRLDLHDAVLVVVSFVVLERPLSWLLYRLKIRQHPY